MMASRRRHKTNVGKSVEFRVEDNFITIYPIQVCEDIEFLYT